MPEARPTPAPPLAVASNDSGETSQQAFALEPPRELSLELGVGMNGRLGRAAGYSQDRGLGVIYGAGLWLSVARATALGLELVRADLGAGSAASGQSRVNAEYSLTGAWLGARFAPWQGEQFRLFVALRLGLSLEHVTAYGVRQPGSPFETATVFDCSGTHGPAFGIAGGAGAIFRVNSRLELVTRFDAHGEQLTSDTVGGCAAGVGSATSLSLGLGLAYGFDGPSGQDQPFAGSRGRRQTW